MDAQKARVRARFIKQQQEALKLRKGGRFIGLTLGAMVITIYGYSMYMIKQETILKEIDDEIEKLDTASNRNVS